MSADKVQEAKLRFFGALYSDLDKQLVRTVEWLETNAVRGEWGWEFRTSL